MPRLVKRFYALIFNPDVMTSCASDLSYSFFIASIIT
jgi:hypothetical protein